MLCVHISIFFTFSTTVLNWIQLAHPDSTQRIAARNVGWVRINGEDLSENESQNHWFYYFFSYSTMDGTKRKFPFPARVAPEESWESNAGRWTLRARWHSKSKFNIMATRKRRRPLIQLLTLLLYAMVRQPI